MKKSNMTINHNDNIFQVEVSGTLDYHGKKIKDQKNSDSTKTLAGMRTIDLSTKAIDIFNRACELNQDQNTDYIFTTEKCTPIQISAINTFLRNYVKPRMNVNKKLSSHIFRHTHVSKLAELGVPLYAIQDRVGHENSKITETIYLHVTKNVRDKVISKIELL